MNYFEIEELRNELSELTRFQHTAPSRINS